MLRLGHKDIYSNSVKKSATRYIRIEFGKLSSNHTSVYLATPEPPFDHERRITEKVKPQSKI